MKRSASIVECPPPTRKDFINLTGVSIGKWKVVGFFGKHPRLKSYYYWECVCECGKSACVPGDHLKRGGSQSCGCGNPRSRIHGFSRTSEYKTWSHMMDRCSNPKNKAFKNYGGRGIFVCEQWRSVEVFIKDMGKKPSTFHEIERVDNNGNYEHSNCIWATPEQQNKNKRNNRWLAFEGLTLCVADWEKRLGFNRAVITKRLKRGWTIHKTLTTALREW